MKNLTSPKGKTIMNEEALTREFQVEVELVERKKMIVRVIALDENEAEDKIIAMDRGEELNWDELDSTEEIIMTEIDCVGEIFNKEELE